LDLRTLQRCNVALVEGDVVMIGRIGVLTRLVEIDSRRDVDASFD
jgi:hypothetical protein